MSQALLTRGGPGARRVREGDCRPRPGADTGPTLDDVITRAWEVLRAGLPATCPVCGGELEPRPSSGGCCGSCGVALS